MLNNNQKKKLRQLANSKDILKFNVGKNALNSEVIDMLDKAIFKHELIKVSFLKTSIEDKKELMQYTLDISAALKADIVQQIGHTVVFYKKNPELKNSINL